MVGQNLAVRDVPLDALMPHRAPMQLLDGMTRASEGIGEAWMVVDPRAWYAQEDGSMPAWFGLELLAQTIAAYSGATKAPSGEAPRIGFLLGTRAFACSVPAFPAGARLDMETRVCFQDDSGLCAFDGTLRLEGEIVAQCTLKVFEQP